MKIGILTFHCAHNYGAVLQSYATQEFLRSKGYDAEIIDYRPDFLLRPYKLFNIRRFLCKSPIRLAKNILDELLTFKLRYKRHKGFEKFISKHLVLSKNCSNGAIPSDYDIYIVGSDQIWNFNITKGDETYFCKFPFKKGCKKYIAYAASMEATKLNNNISYEKLLDSFDAISVREKNLQHLLSPLTNLKIEHVLDPTLMVPSNMWNSLDNGKTYEEKYIVVYQVRENNDTIRIARHLAEQIGAKIKILVAWLGKQTSENNQSATPEDFVNTIRNAACVVTTSFHGTAFSVIFNRPFYTIKLNDGADSRSQSLLKALNLEDRLINIDDTPSFEEIEYKEINEKLDVLRRNSQDFILKNI